MTIKLPRVNVVISDARGFDSQGELSTLSVGFGLHQSWIYAAMFGTSTLFNTRELFPVGAREVPVTSITGYFIVSIIAFSLTLLFIGITDQKFLRVYTSKRALAISTVVASLSTFALFLSSLPDPIGSAVIAVAGVASGVASALVLIFWGTAFARCSSSSIVINGVLAIVIAMLVYSIILYAIPNPAAGVVTALLPLAELPLLWQKTPESYILRHEVPIFQPLPVRKGRFSVRFGAPVLLAGFALGSLRSICTQVILPSPSLSVNALILIAAAIVVVAVLMALLFAGLHRYWDSLLRVMIPIALLALCFAPISVSDDSIAASIALISGYTFLEALLWIFFGQLCQAFRLSSAFIFGIGRGLLALGSLAGTMTLANTAILDALTPFGPHSGILLYMAALVIAYMFMPRVRDVKRMIDPDFEHRHTPLDDINNEMAELDAVVRDQPRSASPLSTISDSGRTTLTEAEAHAALNARMISTDDLMDAETMAAIDAANAQWTREHGASDNEGKASRTTDGGQEGNGQASGAHDAPRTAAAGTRGAQASARSFETAQAEGGVRAGRSSARAAADEDAASRGTTTRKSGRFRSQCEDIANRYLLSRRETEVLFLLAKGYNAAYIQKKLCITQSTAKTHIYHIYQKLNIHTQQELLAMISDEPASQPPAR